MKHFNLIKTFLLLFALVVGGGSSAWAEDVTLTAGTNGSTCTVNDQKGIKVGTSNKGGDMSITVPANTTKLTLHAAAWKGVTGLSLKVSGATVSPNEISLTADDGITGISPFTLSGSESDFEFEISLSDVTKETKIKFESSNAKRFVVWGASAETSGGGKSLTASDFALTNAPIALGFDLYNNSSAQVINYTTSSTGAVTVSESDYVTTVVDENNKTITVTPKSLVTPSAQTITVSQAADNSYEAGAATFTVTIDDSTPIPTHTATFSVNGVTSSTDYEEGAAIVFPSDPASIDDKVFMGWVNSAIVGTTDDAPSFISSATMGKADVTFYAVFATQLGSGDPVWVETPLSAMTASDVFVVSNGSYAMTNNNGTGSAPSAEGITVSEGKITSVVADNLKWNVSGNATDGYTFYPNGDSEKWLYCNTTASSSSNNNIRVGTGGRKLWEFDASGYLKTKDTYTTRFLSIYDESDFRGYINANSGAFVPKFYKYTSSVSYSGYCTTVAADTREAVNITSFTATETTLIKGNTTATAVVNDQAGWTAAYTYASDNTDVATVAADGVITAVGKGTANITATLDVDKEDANYKKGTTFSKSIEITVNNPSHTVAFYDNGTKISETSVEEEAAIVFPTNPTPAVGGFMYEGWATAAIDGTAAVKPATVTEANMGAADINYYAVYGDVQKREVTATFDASDISNLTSVGTRTWKDNDTDIQLALSNGQHYTNGTPNTWTVTKGTSNYFEISTTGALTSIVATISGGDYKINSVSVGSFVTNGTTQTVNKLNNATSVKCYATENYQIRATEIVVKAIVDKTVGYVTTLPANATITISAAGYATYCSSAALDFTGITTLTAYTATKDVDGVTFNKVTGKVPANTGLLVSGETTNVPVCASADPVTNLLVGVTTETVKDAGTVFVLMNGSKGIGFYKNSNAFTVRANSAYLPAEAVETAGARAFIGFDDDTTGIAEVNTQKEDAKRMFDLQGRKVTKTAKGLYVVDGRKVVVK